MKAYLIITGALFALLALLHVWLTINHWQQLSDPGFLVQGPGIGLVAGVLCFWALWLLRRSARPGQAPAKETDHGTPRSLSEPS
jgi:hypothetical protein